jgi:glutamate carboxypeptidase
VLCHYDTVWPLGTLAKQPFEIRDGRAYGPGVYDMKASIAMVETALQAIQSLGEDLPRPLLVLLTSDEEIGSPSSRPHIEQLAQESAYVLVAEPPAIKGALKTSRKGVGRFIVEVNGRASHAGTQPEKGISATHELAHQILRLGELNDPTKGTTVNVGIMHGGTRRNVVAARAVAEVDVRAWTREETERLKSAIYGLKPVHDRAVIKVRGGFGRPPMERSEANVSLFHKAQEVGRALGLELSESASGGGSDANFTSALGVPTLDGLGAVGDGAHADDEHILLEPLPIRTALLAALILDF